MTDDRQQAGRAVRALIAICLLLAAIPCVDLVGRAVRLGTSTCKIASGASEDEALDVRRILPNSVQASSDIPPSFEDETFSFGSLEGVCCSSDTGVICFSLQEPANESFDQVRGWLEASGWDCVESGKQNMASFSKKEGSYHWLFLSSVAVGVRSAVVLQCPGFYQEG